MHIGEEVYDESIKQEPEPYNQSATHKPPISPIKSSRPFSVHAIEQVDDSEEEEERKKDKRKRSIFPPPSQFKRMRVEDENEDLKGEMDDDFTDANAEKTEEEEGDTHEEKREKGQDAREDTKKNEEPLVLDDSVQVPSSPSPLLLYPIPTCPHKPNVLIGAWLYCNKIKRLPKGWREVSVSL